MVRRCLPFSERIGSCLHDFFQPVTRGGCCMDHWATKFFRECSGINYRLLLCIDVRLVQRHDDRNTQFEQLCREEQRAAEIGCVHNIDDRVRMLIANIDAGNTLFRRERRHGISAGQIYRDQLLIPGKSLFDQSFFLVYRHPCPVADLLIASGQGIVHGCFSRVWVSCKCNSHGVSSCFSILMVRHS